ncbi:NAD(P)/FAD-dependent oxidoreductase [Candidatus Omnitrophota bacterium]
MKKIIVIGGGFAGISALAKLSKLRNEAEIVLIDKKEEFNFLPMLPDIVGRGVRPRFLTNDLQALSKRFGFNLIKDKVKKIDLEKKEVTTASQKIAYDYIVIASGSETNFYGNSMIEQNSHTLDSVNDVQNILKTIDTKKPKTIVIGGGGYTGIEIATNIRRHLVKCKRDSTIVIVERAPSLLGPLPEWMKAYVSQNLKRLSIEAFTECVIEKVENGTIWLSNGKNFDTILLIWSAGVKTADFIFELHAQKTPQGRIKVDEYLRLSDTCFVVGDATQIFHKEKPLRMAIQFAIAQGQIAAENIIRSIRGKPLKKYKPIDLGYVVPMANNYSCGTVLGVNLKGKLPTFFHYFMCIYRSVGLNNRLGIFVDLIKGGGGC